MLFEISDFLIHWRCLFFEKILVMPKYLYFDLTHFVWIVSSTAPYKMRHLRGCWRIPTTAALVLGKTFWTKWIVRGDEILSQKMLSGDVFIFSRLLRPMERKGTFKFTLSCPRTKCYQDYVTKQPPTKIHPLLTVILDFFENTK